MKTVRRRRRIPPKPSRYAIVAQQYLEHAEAIWNTADFDTAVRDEVATGLAYIVRAAYDCQALDTNLQGIAFSLYIDQHTAEWFRKREFAEWFCLAAASGFNSSRPREVADFRWFKVVRRKRKPPLKTVNVERSKPRRKDPSAQKAKTK